MIFPLAVVGSVITIAWFVRRRRQNRQHKGDVDKADQLYIAEQTATGDRDHDSIAPITEYLEHYSDQRCSVAARATQRRLCHESGQSRMSGTKR